MRPLAIATLVLVAATGAARADAYCDTVGRVAEVTMQARQAGMDISKLMANADEQPNARAVLRPMIVDAFSQPRMSDPGDQKRAVDEFRNKAELACYEEEK